MTIPISKRAQALKPSPTMSVTALASKMAAEGISIINFGVGEPDFNTPENIKQAAHQALDANFTHYTVSAGILELRQAICDKLKRDNNLDYSPDEIIVAPGGKAAIITTLAAICDPDDEIIIPAPYWVSYPSQVEMLDGKPVFIATDESTNFKITADQLESVIKKLSQPKALILNSPNNPTGAVYSPTELAAIGAVCLKHNLAVISDEIYEKLVYGSARHYSIVQVLPEIRSITIVINGFSKAYAMTGWRVGYAAGPREVIKRATAIQEHTASCVTSITQKAAVAALNGDDSSIEAMRQEFERRRDYLVNELKQIPLVDCPLPDGAFYAFPNISHYIKNNKIGVRDSVQLCEYLLKNFHIALVPGSAFGCDDCLRFSYATSMENIVEGVKRFKSGLASL
ncbi:MAG TPA: pyridoxal phosphate-dependent aminotransferase [Candidatus Marinimicrobia bacterium]|nr:pyridoxal phosphate-dependent aminotransferase [Candidatus Neomarinimicrobiota bacterium]